MIWTKVVDEIKTYVLCSIIFPPKNCAIDEIMWKNIVEQGRPHETI
jgi:hypothetical protein